MNANSSLRRKYVWHFLQIVWKVLEKEREKNIIRLPSAEFAQKVVQFNFTRILYMDKSFVKRMQIKMCQSEDQRVTNAFGRYLERYRCVIHCYVCLFIHYPKALFKFVCNYWQWPILIKCVKCYNLCVLTWLMRSILALNCLLQIAQERSEEESSVGDALALAFRCAHFC